MLEQRQRKASVYIMYYIHARYWLLQMHINRLTSTYAEFPCTVITISGEVTIITAALVAMLLKITGSPR